MLVREYTPAIVTIGLDVYTGDLVYILWKGRDVTNAASILSGQVAMAREACRAQGFPCGNN